MSNDNKIETLLSVLNGCIVPEERGHNLMCQNLPEEFSSDYCELNKCSKCPFDRAATSRLCITVIGDNKL